MEVDVQMTAEKSLCKVRLDSFHYCTSSPQIAGVGSPSSNLRVTFQSPQQFMQVLRHLCRSYIGYAVQEQASLNTKVARAPNR